MTWEWSHTHEAYQNAETNLRNLPVAKLIEIAAEWYAQDGSSIDVESFDVRVAELTKEHDAGILHADLLAAWIWDKASEQRSCSNGGFECYLCPFGCGPHSVPFDLDSENSNQEEN